APPPKHDSRPTVADVVNGFLDFKKGLVASEELAQRSWDGYFAVGKILADHFGRDTAVELLTPIDWQKFRKAMAKNWGPVRLGNAIQVARMMFKFAFESDIIAAPPKYGPGFAKPSAKTLRIARAKKGNREYTPEQIQSLLKVASPNMKAMTLLGI